jgi:alpha-ketoglutarate-dependent taurine dioxygenase
MTPVPPPAASAVRIVTDWEGRALPALIRAEHPDTDLAAWLSGNRDTVDDLARRHGAVLLRGFPLTGAEDLKTAMDALSSQVLAYGERSSPRTLVSPGVYTSTEYPNDQPIVLHNEQSYTGNWPLRIVFFCQTAPVRGGSTPLADSRRILARLSAATVERFERLGVEYVRNYLPGISLGWQEAFQTERREDVAEYGEQEGITIEWISADHLRTRQVRPAVRSHPVTGDRTWFNHAAFFHVTSLPEEVSAGLIEALPEEDLPYNTYYGDGSPIDRAVLDEIRAAMSAETVDFPWERGDLLVVENMITAHGRAPFEGPRRILVAMADPFRSAPTSPARAGGGVR